MYLPPELEWLSLPAPNPDRSVSRLILFVSENKNYSCWSDYSYFPLLTQHHLSGVLWMIQLSAGSLAVPMWTMNNTAAVMQAFTWVAPLRTVSVRVSYNYVLLNWFMRGNSLLLLQAVTEQSDWFYTHLGRANRKYGKEFYYSKCLHMPESFNSLLFIMG